MHRLEARRCIPGSGLGLSLVAAVADLHGIVIRLDDNQPGLEMHLIFELAARAATPVSDATASEAAPGGRQDQGGQAHSSPILPLRPGEHSGSSGSNRSRGGGDNGKKRRVAGKRGRVRSLSTCLLAAALVVLGFSGQSAWAQDATPPADSQDVQTNNNAGA